MTTAAHASTATAIAARLGGGVVDTEEACRACAVGGVVPASVARPAAAADVAAVVAAVGACGGALVALGRGAHRALGHAPARYDLALVTDRLERVIEYTPADMTVTVEAGVRIADLAALLARDGQWLPIDPPTPDATTAGGLVATDRSGLLAASQGRVRDFVIGIGVVTASGAVARAGGRVVKNVAGYDLMKLFVGSLGTLAVVTEVTLKVRPLPEVQRLVALCARSATDAFALAAGIEGAFAVVVDGTLSAPAHARVTVRLGGSGPDVAVQRDRILGRLGTVVALDAETTDPSAALHWTALRDFPVAVDAALVVRFAAVPGRLGSLVGDAVRVAAAGAGDRDAARAAVPGAWQADVARGILTLAVDAATPEAVRALVDAFVRVADAHSAHLVVERWPLGLASTVDVWHPRPAAFALMRRMKMALDPAGVLAPGRYVGRL